MSAVLWNGIRPKRPKHFGRAHRLLCKAGMLLSERFEDLPAWQAAADLYGFAEGLLKEPELGASVGWRDQFDRAALSISSHLARGSERTSNGERAVAIGQARAAVAEVRSMLRVLERRKVAREVQVPVARLKALADACATQLRACADSLSPGVTSPALPGIAARPPEIRPPLASSASSPTDIRRRTVEVARKILGILPHHPK